MDKFDSYIINVLHNFSANSPKFNDFMLFISENDFIKSCVVLSVLWFFWFQSKDNILVRKKIINTLFSCIIAIAVDLLLVHFLPFRTRPLDNPHTTFLFPFPSSTAPWFGKMSSLPSDHAVMFYALVTGIFLISKKIGLLTFLYVSFFVTLPRIYLGYHYPTDILAGAALGILITLMFSLKRISDPISTKAIAFSSKYSGIFYLLFFWLSFQIGTVFNSSHGIIQYIKNLF